jgi:signal transduction histidine kinase
VNVDVAALASQALLARESEAAGRDLDVHALDMAPAAGDPRLLERLIANLLDNAIRHNTQGGQVEITTGTHDRHAFLSIANTGPAVPPEQIQEEPRRLGVDRALARRDWLKQYDGDDATARSLLVGVIAVVVVVHALPQLAAFGLVDHPWSDSDVLAPELDRHGIGVGAEVVVPGRVMSGTRL